MRIPLWVKVVVVVGFLLTVCAVVYFNARASADPGYQDDSGLPTLPTQIVNGDGSRMNCTPNGHCHVNSNMWWRS